MCGTHDFKLLNPERQHVFVSLVMEGQILFSVK